MADLLTHVAVAYVVSAAAVRAGYLPDRLLPVVAVGAVTPDLMKPTVPLGVVRGELAGVTYSLWGLHTLGGIVVLAGVGALTLRSSDRRVGWLALVGGGCSHLLLDLLVIRVDGLAPPYLFPLTTWLPPAGNVYASFDVWPALVACSVALAVFLARRRRALDRG